jgi:hypothetical protein
VEEAEDIIADLFNRAMNLTFNGSEKRAPRARALVKKDDKRKAQYKSAALPFLCLCATAAGAGSGHLQIALALFPLGAGANELMGLVFCRPTTAVPQQEF